MGKKWFIAAFQEVGWSVGPPDLLDWYLYLYITIIIREPMTDKPEVGGAASFPPHFPCCSIVLRGVIGQATRPEIRRKSNQTLLGRRGKTLGTKFHP